MCGRYSFTTTVTDEHLIAIYQAMEKRYAGAYKTGEIFPGDSAPAVIQRESKIIAVPCVFGLPGFQGKRLLINARSETAAEKHTFAESLPITRIFRILIKPCQEHHLNVRGIIIGGGIVGFLFVYQQLCLFFVGKGARHVNVLGPTACHALIEQ